MKGLKLIENCCYGSYNAAAEHFGLRLPIKFGLLQTFSWGIYVWYIEYRNKYSFIPVFKEDQNKLNDFGSKTDFRVIFIPPDNYFDHNGNIYFYNAEDLSIYILNDYLDIVTVINILQIHELPYNRVWLVKVYQDNFSEEIYAWYLSSSDDSNTMLLPVFGDDTDTLKQIYQHFDRMEYAKKDECFIHGDEIYQLTLNPQTGITVEPVEFNVSQIFN